MKNQDISSPAELKQRIMHLKYEVARQEEQIKYDLKELYYSLEPISLIKHTLNSLTKDKEVQTDVTKIGFNLGTDFLIGKALGRNKTIKGFIASLLFEKVAAPILRNGVPKLMSGVTKLLKTRALKQE